MNSKQPARPSRQRPNALASGLAAISVAFLCANAAMAQTAVKPIESLIQQGRFAEAERALRTLPSPDAQVDYLLGFTLIQLYRYEEAETALRRSVEARPNDVSRLHALAKSLLEQGKNLAAIEILDRAIAVEERPELFFARAMCALNVGRGREAEEDLVASLAIQPRNAEALYKLGKLQFDRGDFPAARNRLAASQELDPGHLEAHFYLGVTELRTGNVRESIDAFERVLGVLPGHVGALYNLARAFQQVGRRSDAEATLERLRRMSAVQDRVDFHERAVQKNPNNVNGRIVLVRLLLEIGKNERALEEAVAARQLAPRRAEVYGLLAEAFERLGRQSEATQARRFARSLEAGS